MSAPAHTTFRIGADIGGTFTDLVFLRPDGRIDKRKVPSTPPQYARAIIDAVLAYCREQNLSPASVEEVVHATTVATNSILERRGAKTALITTEGFRDVLELRRIRIPLTYDLDWHKPPPLVEREWRFTIPERIDAQGNIKIPLDLAALDPIIDTIVREGIEAVAVCLLHSYREPKHERRIGEVLRARLPGVHISLSSEVLPEMLEFERTSTTVTNAYLAPLVGRYLNSLREDLNKHDLRGPLLVMQSNGGLISSGFAAYRPVTIVESGPAAGVVAAGRVAHASGYANVITLDMGGTTTKASIIENGKILRAHEYEVGSPISVSSRLMRGSGYMLRIPIIDVSEVGAGGGSIASVDHGGSLKVGPQSAGAVPGPACYGRGNHRPTVTDANMVLGYLGEGSLAGGSLTTVKSLAEDAVLEHVGKSSGLSLLDAAYGIYLVANSNMVRAIKTVSVERGRDPRDFVLMAFGGAGPIHAAELARALRIEKVIVPAGPGVFSAYGLLGAEIELHSCRTVLRYQRDNDPGALQAALEDMRSDLVQRLGVEGFSAADVVTSSGVDICYRGQSSELMVPISSEKVTDATIREAFEAFEQEYERTYGHRSDKKQFDIVNARMVATVRRLTENTSTWAEEPKVSSSAETSRAAYFGREHGLMQTAVISRSALRDGPKQGPVIVQEYDTTVVIPPGCSAELDKFGAIIITVGAA
jgi:N-methylhydantoinase A